MVTARSSGPNESVVLYNAACTYCALRRKPEQELDDETAAAIEDTSDNPETVAAKKDTSNALRNCLTALSPEHREIVDLVYYHEKSVEEVGQIIGIPQAMLAKTLLGWAMSARVRITTGTRAWLADATLGDVERDGRGLGAEPLQAFHLRLDVVEVQHAGAAGVHPGQRALDVGCGPGALTAELVARLGETGFLGAYSLIAFATLGWMILAWRAVRNSFPLWAAPAWAWSTASCRCCEPILANRSFYAGSSR